MKKFINNINTYNGIFYENYSFFKQFKFILIFSLIFIFLDITNLFSKYIIEYMQKLPLKNINVLYIIISIIIVIFFVLTLIESGILTTFRFKYLNILDYFLSSSIFILLIYGISIFCLSKLSNYKIITLCTLFSIFIILQIIRISIFISLFNKMHNNESNIIDLKKFLEEDITEDKNILFNEEDVNYDLLNRNHTIMQLYNTIILSNPNNKFVISLEGEWGSGKTTIINNVKDKLSKHEEIIIIDTFNPWIYNAEEALLKDMFNLIAEKSGFKFHGFFPKELSENILEIILGKSNKIVKPFIFDFSENNLQTLKNKISNYLKFSNKKIVFFIDDLDRIGNNNIALLFKLIGSVLNINRITYVMLFDSNRIKSILQKNYEFDCRYLEKIIQLQIHVPKIDINLSSELYYNILKKLLRTHLSEEELDNYDNTIALISQKDINIRNFKRFLNSMFSKNFMAEHYLYKLDLLVLDYIQFFNPELYIIIYQNKKYFVSFHIEDVGYYIDKGKWITEKKDFFAYLFSSPENKIYKNILANIFPAIEDSNYNYSNYTDFDKNNRAASSKYFDLYFTITTNNHVKTEEKIKQFINNLETSYVPYKFFENIPITFNLHFLERIQSYLDDLKEEASNNLLIILVKIYNQLDNSFVSLSLNAKKRTEVIISKLIIKITDKNYKTFLSKRKTDYSRFNLIMSLTYWIEGDNKAEKNFTELENIRLNKLKNLQKEIGEKILNKKIDLYDCKNFNKENTLSLYWLYKEIDLKKLKEYLQNTLNKKNVFKFIYSVTTFSYSSNGVYRYTIYENILTSNCLSIEDKIDNILKNIDSSSINESEKFLWDVYKNYKSGITDEFRKLGIVSFYEKKINL